MLWVWFGDAGFFSPLSCYSSVGGLFSRVMLVGYMIVVGNPLFCLFIFSCFRHACGWATGNGCPYSCGGYFSWCSSQSKHIVLLGWCISHEVICGGSHVE